MTPPEKKKFPVTKNMTSTISVSHLYFIFGDYALSVMVNCVDNINYVELDNNQYRNTTVDLNMALYNQVTESQLTLK